MSIVMEIKPLLMESESTNLINLYEELKVLLNESELKWGLDWGKQQPILNLIDTIKKYIIYSEDPEELKKRKNWNYDICRKTLLNMIRSLRNHKSYLLRRKKRLIDSKQKSYLEVQLKPYREEYRKIKNEIYNKMEEVKELRKCLEDSGTNMAFILDKITEIK